MSSGACLLGLIALTFTFSGGGAIVGNGTECTRAPPNIERIAMGVDISSLDLLPLDFTNEDGYKKPVVDFTCNEQRVFLDKGEEYQMPDQVFSINRLPGGMQSATVQNYKTSSDIKDSFTTALSVGADFKVFSFSVSASYSKLQETVTKEERYVSDTFTYQSTNKVELYPGYILPLNPVAKLFLDQEIGSKTYESDPEIYHKFISLFGTHYFSSAQFGGQVRRVYSTSQEYMRTHTEEELKITIKLMFKKKTKTRRASRTEEEFKKHTSNSVRYYGGSTNLLRSDGGFEAWQPTVDASPWLFTGSLKPISELIENDSHRNGMEQAALQHVMRNHFLELRRQLEAGRDKLGYTTMLHKLETRLARMEHLGLGKLVETDIEALSQDIESAVTVPRWFSKDTKLCFRWSAPKDARQCDGHPESCAVLGEWTHDYRDDTDGRDGGCHMQWSIESQHAENWFNRVAVCYRWEAEGDVGQCSGEKKKEVCAKPNKYTPAYIDDTDHRDGGCKMSWKLKIPNDAPMWLKLAKLCFKWRPDGDKGQCGPAQSQIMCAKANHWTPYYRDDTDWRGGGCVLNWALQLDH